MEMADEARLKVPWYYSKYPDFVILDLKNNPVIAYP